jgi:hypothetical protein
MVEHDYMEVDVKHVPCIQQAQNEVLGTRKFAASWYMMGL